MDDQLQDGSATGSEETSRWRRPTWLLAAGLVAVVLVVVVVVVVRQLGDEHECNGTAGLCDLRLDQVALATTHNSMNAAADGFDEPSQESGMEQQLADGVRGFLIDAFLGSVRPLGDDDVVYTDLPRRELARALSLLGPEAAERAQMLRQRIGPPAATAPREVYLCHRLCELGAVPFSDVVATLRRFLETHPSDVLVIVVQDELPAEDLVPVLTDGGLEPYLATIDPTQPMPTLGSMVDSGRRVLIGLENGDLGPQIPNVYDDGLLQEVPYDYASPEELESPDSCRPNRGQPDAPLFALNHWVTPPSEEAAAEVNSVEFLQNRVDRCAQERGQPVNLVAVDFYETGDLMGVVNELNRRAPDSG
ncbi:MAG TPA: hypothetical protein VFV89_12525 [Nocardioides sp.]|uniref:hypothetical protein n=1 Tax=Nocardioides sp. TaxID=35761 RepID=UPI002E359831|nr:hypothetical protein [Nocardioides sp.]HEX5088627.1 hypothetical protein [Nocardioides sp.]